MQVKCVLCDLVEGIDEYSLQAKRLRNRRIRMYLCDQCYTRIEKKTNDRHATGKFNLYNSNEKNSKLI